jgi:DNA-binding transcriptional ArsR family regulator
MIASLSPCEDTTLHPEAVQAARQTLVDDLSAARLAESFQALADPTRLRIVSALLDQELCVCDLAVVLNMSQSAISHQLHLLRYLNIVRYRKEGRVVYYTLDDEHIRNLFQLGLQHILHSEEPAE